MVKEDEARMIRSPRRVYIIDLCELLIYISQVLSEFSLPGPLLNIGCMKKERYLGNNIGHLFAISPNYSLHHPRQETAGISRGNS